MSSTTYTGAIDDPFDRRKRQGASPDGVEHRTGKDRRLAEGEAPAEAGGERRRGLRERVKSAAGAVVAGGTAAGREAVVRGKRAIGPGGRRVVRKGVEVAPTAAKKSLLAKRIAEGTAAAALLLGGGAATYEMLSSETAPSDVLEPPNGKNHSVLEGAFPSATPPPGVIFPDSARQAERIPVSYTNAQAEPVGIIVDITAEQLAKYRLELGNEHHSAFLRTIPQKASNETLKTEYLSVKADPMSDLGESATSKDVSEILEKWRVYLRKKGLGGSAELLYRGGGQIDGLPKKTRVLEIPMPSVDDVSGAENIADFPSNGKVAIRVNLGSTNSAAYTWLTEIKNVERTLQRALDDALNTGDSFTYFLQEAVTDPQTGRFDPVAQQALLRVFALTPEDRKAFTTAMGNGDYNRASTILLYCSAEIPVSEELFYALSNFIQKARNNGFSAAEISECLVDCAYYHPYDDMPSVKAGKRSDNLIPLLHETLTKEQYKTLQSLPDHMFTLVGSQLESGNRFDSYAAFVYEHDRYLMSPSMATEESLGAPIPTLPMHTFNSLQAYSTQFLGSGSRAGWIDNTDPKNNLLSLLALLEQRAQLQEIADIDLNRFITVQNGTATLSLEVPTNGFSGANQTLAMLSSVFSAANSAQRPFWLESANGLSRPVDELATEFFAIHPYSSSGGANGKLFYSPGNMIAALNQCVPLTTEVKTALSSSGNTQENAPNAELIVAEPYITTSGIEIRNLLPGKTYTSLVTKDQPGAALGR